MTISRFPHTMTAMSKSRYDSVVFYSALGLSVAIHVWFFALWLIMRLPEMRAAKKQAHTNITYFSKSAQARSEFIPQDDRPADVQSSKVKSKDARELDPFFERKGQPKAVTMEPDFLGAKAVSGDKAQPHFSETHADKHPSKIALQKISIPMVSSGSIRPENYPDYFNKIGEKIRKKAYEMVKRSRQLSGEFRLSFSLKPNGQVMDVRVSANKPDPGHQLGDLVADIVRAASPFESFPKEMGSQEISCDVAIEFR